MRIIKILICNDDGIASNGIVAVKDAVKEFGETFVVAPQVQHSGTGRSLTVTKPIQIEKTSLNDGTMGFEVSGTPADCVLAGISQIIGEKPDLVISGINIGENIGKYNMTISGTIGAATEAAAQGIPTVAISQEVRDKESMLEKGDIPFDFDLAKKILVKIVKKIISNGLPESIDILNVNIPEDPKNEDIISTNLGDKIFELKLEKEKNPLGMNYYWISGDIVNNEIKKGTDEYVLKVQNQVTITPLIIDITGNKDNLNDWLKID